MVLTAASRPRDRSDEAGMIAVATALVVVFVVMPLSALVVDLGLTRVWAGQATSAADGAALAAALRYSRDGDLSAATSAAQRVAQANFGGTPQDWATCVDQHPLPAGTAPSPGNCVSFDLPAKRVRVHVPERQVPSVFAGVLGTTPPASTGTATATWGGFRGACTLCVLDDYQGGAQDLVVTGGDIGVGGLLSVPSAAALRGDADRTLSFAGNLDISGTVTPTPVPGPAPVDPLSAALAALVARPEASSAAVSLPGPQGICSPGTYQDISGCTSFARGLYVVTGSPYARQTVTFQTAATGAVFYFTCSTPWWVYPVHPARCSSTVSRAPRVSGAVSGPVTLTGDASSYGGLVLAFDPTMTATQRFAGNGTLTVAGSIDGPGIVLRDPSTTASAQLIVDGGRLVVGRVNYGTAYPGHPYVTVRAPSTQPLPDGPVRLVPSG